MLSKDLELSWTPGPLEPYLDQHGEGAGAGGGGGGREGGGEGGKEREHTHGEEG